MDEKFLRYQIAMTQLYLNAPPPMTLWVDTLAILLHLIIPQHLRRYWVRGGGGGKIEYGNVSRILSDRHQYLSLYLVPFMLGVNNGIWSNMFWR